jgi:Tfp pilus assembly protein PilV
MDFTFSEAVILLSLLALVFWWANTHLKRTRAMQWDATEAVVETVRSVNRGHYSYSYVTEIGYSYKVSDNRFAGNVAVPANWWQIQPSPSLVGTKVQVRVNPRKPDESVLISSSLPGIDQSIVPVLLVQGANQ